MRLRCTRARVTVLMVAVLVLLDVALVAGAFGWVRAEPGAVSSAPTSDANTPNSPILSASTSTTSANPPTQRTQPTRPTQPSTSTSTSTASATQPPPRTAAPEQQHRLVAMDGNSAWRMRSGVCGAGGAAIETSADGGRTWVSRISPFPVLTRVQPASGTTAFVVGASNGCAMGVRGTGDAGRTWSDVGDLNSTWALDTRDRTTVRVPIGQTATPCGREVVLELVRATASTAQVLCAAGQLLQSTDEGRTWTSVGRFAGALTFDNRVETGAVTAYVVAPGPGCAGLSVSRVRPGEVTRVGCVGFDPTRTTPGTVSLSIAGAQGWLLVGTTTWRSRDGLRTWFRV